MQIPRPSSPRNQDVTAVLADVFKELHEGHVLEDETIDNLTISRTNGDDFHDYYVELISQIKRERNERLEALDSVEQHMMSAYTLACSAYDNESIVPSEDTLNAYLDHGIMEKFHLLTPSSYLPIPAPNLKEPSPPSLPHYMSITKNTSEKEKGKQSRANKYPVPPTSAKKPGSGRREFKTKTLDPKSKDEEMKKLELLKAKSNFLKSKRFKENDEIVLISEPQVIEFLDYEPTKVYEKKLKIKNVSTVSRQVQILPPTTPFFTFTKLSDPGDTGCVAPGLCLEYRITFMPNSRALFDDELQVFAQGGTAMSVPLRGRRTPPSLTLPNELDVGHCLVYGTLKTSFVCKNVGGEGRFYILPKGRVETPFLFDKLVPPEAELQEGPFKLYPTAFGLNSGSEMSINIEFHPVKEDDFEAQFEIVASDCTSNLFTLTALSEWCKVQTLAISGGKDDTINYDIRYEESPEKEILVKFDDQNPGTVEHKLMIIRNCVKVPLHYTWEVSQELAEAETPVEPLLKPDPLSPFIIEPASGILNPYAEASFNIVSSPLKVGQYDNVARLWIDDVPFESGKGDICYDRSELTRIRLRLLTQPHVVKVSPPALAIPGVGVVGQVVCKTLNVVNDSLADIRAQWQYCSSELLDISVEPVEIVVGAKQSLSVNVMIVSKEPGDIEGHVILTVEHMLKPVVVLVKGKFRGPKVLIKGESPALDFGYIRYVPGVKVQRELNLVNTDPVPARWTLSEMPECINKEYGQSEFEFSLASGVLEPLEVRQVHVSYGPKYPRSLQSYLQCKVAGGGTGAQIRAIAEVELPKLILTSSVVDLGLVYLDVPVAAAVQIESLNFVDCKFRIRPPEGTDRAFGKIQFEAEEGQIYAGSCTAISFTFTGLQVTAIEDFILVIDIEDSEERLVFQVKARVEGLSVIHETPDPDQLVPETGAEKFDKPMLEFGEVNILTPTTRALKIINNTAIATRFELEVVEYEGAHLEMAAPISHLEQPAKSGSELLSRTPYVPVVKVSPNFWDAQLKTNKGACFALSPRSGVLPAYGVTIVTVHGSADMWGRYEDVLISRVGDLPPVHIPIRMNVIGSPITFKVSNTASPIIRFGNYSPRESPVARAVVIVNRGPMDIRLDWVTFNTLQDDPVLVDLDFFIGDAFPREEWGPILDPDRDLIRLRLNQHQGELSHGPFRFSPAQCTVPGRGSTKVTLWFDPDYNLAESCKGFFNSFALAYQSLDRNMPSESCFRASGEDVMPLRIEMTGKVNVPELTVAAEAHGFTFKLLAGVINANKGSDNYVKIHRMSLLNATQLNLNYTLHTVKPFILNGPLEPFTLKPRDKHKVVFGFELSEELVKTLMDINKEHYYLKYDGKKYEEAASGSEVEVTAEENILTRSHDVKGQEHPKIVEVPEVRFYLHGNIKIKYSNGHVQPIPVKARVIFPVLYILPDSIDFGECLVGQPTDKTVRLVSPTNAPLTWTVEDDATQPPGDVGLFVVSPRSGSFPVCNDVMVTVSFTAFTDQQVSEGKFWIVSQPGNRRIPFRVRGRGSHDERMKRMM